MVNVYKRTWQVVWAEQWQYRANLLMYLLFWLISPIVFLAVWASIATANGSVGGLDANDFVSYYLMMLFVSIVTADITIHVFTYKIQDGSLSSELVLPVHPVLTRGLIINLGFKALQLIVFIPAWIALIFLFQPEFSVTLRSVALGAIACVLGFIVNFFFGAIISCIAFWTTRVYTLDALIRFAIGRMLSGEFVPLQLLPLVLQGIAFVAPFQYGLYFPVQVILNKLPDGQIWIGFGMQLLWSVILAGVFTLQWRAAIKKYSAVGA
jgi:ABC-2 type transport system permease protein